MGGETYVDCPHCGASTIYEDEEERPMPHITLDQIENAIQATVDSMEEGVEYVISESYLEKINKARSAERRGEWERNYWCWKKENGKLYESNSYICEETEMATKVVMEMGMGMGMVFILGEIEPREKVLTVGDLKPGAKFFYRGSKHPRILLLHGSGDQSAVEDLSGTVFGVSKSWKVDKVES